MKMCKALIAVFMIVIMNQAFGQQNDIYVVKFDFYHSKRVPDNFVSVDFHRYGDSIRVDARSLPSDTVHWKKTKKEFVFWLNLIEFDKVIRAVQKINCSDIMNNVGFDGLDGTSCQIEIGGIGSGIIYKVWSPDIDTEKRRLKSFLDACKLILVTAKLDPAACLQ